jgi:hypothetical protein
MDPLPAFAHGLVGQADDPERGQARRHLALHLDTAGFETEIGNRGNERDHGRQSARRLPPHKGPGAAPARSEAVSGLQARKRDPRWPMYLPARSA